MNEVDSSPDCPDPDLQEAARLLDMSADTLRKRIKRGQTYAYKVNGRWYVPCPGAVPDQSRTAVQASEPGRQVDSSPDVRFLQAEIERLWAELRERDALIARLTALLPAPEALPTGNPPESAAPRLSWWRRLLGAFAFDDGEQQDGPTAAQ